MATDFPIGKVFVAGYHDTNTKDQDVQCHPFEFESLSEGCHNEQEEDRHHVVPLTDSSGLGNFSDLILKF